MAKLNLRESDFGYKSGDRYYGGLPAEPDYTGLGKKARYWKELIQYFKDTVEEYPEYFIIGSSPVAITLRTPDGKETIDLTKFDALADADEAIEMASHYFDESLFEARKKKKNGALVNPDAGNVEHNIEMFNKMNSPVDGPCNNPISGPFGGDVGGGCSESLNEAASKAQMSGALASIKNAFGSVTMSKEHSDKILTAIGKEPQGKEQTIDSIIGVVMKVMDVAPLAVGVFVTILEVIFEVLVGAGVLTIGQVADGGTPILEVVCSILSLIPVGAIAGVLTAVPAAVVNHILHGLRKKMREDDVKKVEDDFSRKGVKLTEGTSKETIELEYKDLEFTQYGNQRDVDDWDEWDRCMDWTYEVDKDDLYTFIFESCIDETDFPEAFEDDFDPNDAEHWARFESWLDDNFDTIFAKYEERILENWEEDAREEAEEEYDPDDYVDWDSMPGGHDDDRYWEDLNEGEEVFMEKYSYGLNEEYKREPKMIDYFEQMNSEEDEA